MLFVSNIHQINFCFNLALECEICGTRCGVHERRESVHSLLSLSLETGQQGLVWTAVNFLLCHYVSNFFLVIQVYGARICCIPAASGLEASVEQDARRLTGHVPAAVQGRDAPGAQTRGAELGGVGPPAQRRALQAERACSCVQKFHSR